MKILFVCRQNIGRSQMAKELYNLHHTEKADSAGTVVDHEEQTLEACGAPKTIAVMKERGIDVSQNKRHQVTESMIGNYDKIIVMAEPEYTPAWLAISSKTERWDITDTKDTDVQATRLICDKLAQLVDKLP